MFGHILSKRNKDMLDVVRFCYPFDNDDNLVKNDKFIFNTAFCD